MTCLTLTHPLAFQLGVTLNGTNTESLCFQHSLTHPESAVLLHFSPANLKSNCTRPPNTSTLPPFTELKLAFDRSTPSSPAAQNQSHTHHTAKCLLPRFRKVVALSTIPDGKENERRRELKTVTWMRLRWAERTARWRRFVCERIYDGHLQENIPV